MLDFHGKRGIFFQKVLRGGMECAYAPFNWTQETDEVDGESKAVPLYEMYPRGRCNM